MNNHIFLQILAEPTSMKKRDKTLFVCTNEDCPGHRGTACGTTTHELNNDGLWMCMCCARVKKTSVRMKPPDLDKDGPLPPDPNYG